MNDPSANSGAYIPGRRLGLPATGRGSLASMPRRIGAFAIDAIAASLVASLFVHNPDLPGIAGRLAGTWSLIPLAVDYVLGLLIAGRTLGMNLLGLRVIRVDRDAPMNLWRVILRTALLFMLVPAVVTDRDGRGLHDRITDAAVIHS